MNITAKLKQFGNRPFTPLHAPDAALVILFIAVAVIGPADQPRELALIAAIGIVQILESRWSFLKSNGSESVAAKVVWILLKLVLGYLLIGFTGGVASYYYLVLLLPVITAATSLNVFGTLLFTVLVCGAYLSFLLFIDFSRFEISPDQARALWLRVIFIAMAGTLVNVLAAALRRESARSNEVARKLAETSRSLGAAEDAVRRSERLAALGQLSAGLAHELRNPLGTIRGSAEMLNTEIANENAIARELAGFISGEVDRMNSLVTRFLDFSRPLKLRLENVDLSLVIDRVVEMVVRDTKSANQVFRNYSPDVPKVPADPDWVERVFYNLLLNAVQASPPGAPVTIKMRRLEDAVEVAFIDRGCGVPSDKMETIFNPFVTSKRDGVGLGLAIVSRIMDEHGGRITVESEETKGSVFRAYFPLVPATPDLAQRVDSANRP